MSKALKRLTALLFVIVFACLSGCAGQTEKREIDYTFTKNNAASFIDDYLAEENRAIGSLVEKINVAETTESDKNGVFDVFDFYDNNRFHPALNFSGISYLTSLRAYSKFAGKIDYIKVIDEETICLTTKIADEKSEFPALMNMIFEQTIYEADGVESWHPTYHLVYNDDSEIIRANIFIESYVTTVKLSKKDYIKIRVGDPAKKVYDIDSAVLLDLLTSSIYGYDGVNIYVSFRILSEGILAIRFKQVDEPISDTGTLLDNLEVYEIDFIEFQEDMPEYYLGYYGFYTKEEALSGNELYVDFSINSADQVEFFEYK